MKTNIAKVLISVFFFLMSLGLMAQVPPHPPSSHGNGGNAPAGPGGGAPVGSGLVLLIGLSAVYGAKKAYSAQQKDEN